GADLPDQVLAQRLRPRWGLVNPGHILVGTPAVAGLPRLTVAAAIKRPVALLAPGIAPVLGSIACHFAFMRVAQRFGKRDGGTVHLCRRGVSLANCRRVITLPLAMFEKRVLLDLG